MATSGLQDESRLTYFQLLERKKTFDANSECPSECLPKAHRVPFFLVPVRMASNYPQSRTSRSLRVRRKQQRREPADWFFGSLVSNIYKVVVLPIRSGLRNNLKTAEPPILRSQTMAARAFIWYGKLVFVHTTYRYMFACGIFEVCTFD